MMVIRRVINPPTGTRHGCRGLLLIGLCLLTMPSLVLAQKQDEAQTPYLIGRGMVDITGPEVGMPLWGFGRPDQIAEGIHIRLRSRAFISVQANDPEQRLVFVSADLGSIDHHMTLEIVERLQRRYGSTYTLDNVIISATHTHAGPSGYWQSRTDTGLDGGLYPAHFDAIVSGITASIVQGPSRIFSPAIFISIRAVWQTRESTGRRLLIGKTPSRSATAIVKTPTQP